MEKSRTACFTGHRPEKLKAASPQEINSIRSMLYLEIKTAADRGYKYFITGMQRGIDLWAGECVLDLMKEYDIELIAAVPYKGFGSNFRNRDKWIFGRILENAGEIVYISERSSKTVYRMRNEYMTDNASLLIAAVDDFNSGTGQTISLARKKGLEIRLIRVDGKDDDDAEQMML
ncbi:MAG: DUF1273 family protein [Oscillospiraceae bacterium]|nr:DUF1273 family protein [Oscillospiraceae bacterium]